MAETGPESGTKVGELPEESGGTGAERGRPAARPRLVDIAEAVGVHVSTVSRVLNGDPAQSIRPEVYELILKTARQQGYRPNALARALKRRRTGALARSEERRVGKEGRSGRVREQ